jgi:tRNA-dihydrouridine synthase C
MKNNMRVLLAPMEGVLDSLVRELLTEVNDYDLCITEFLRVVDQLLPVKRSTDCVRNCITTA